MRTKWTLLLLLSFTLIITSCSKDDDDPSYTFIDQDLQGEIEGETWVYLTGTAETSYFDDTNLDIDFAAVASDNPCDEWNFTGNRVFFSIPDAVGLYELNFDLNGDPQTVTLYHVATTMNNIATVGAVEITLIDKVNGIVEGRIAAEYDATNFVNGNFSIEYCVD